MAFFRNIFRNKRDNVSAVNLVPATTWMPVITANKYSGKERLVVGMDLGMTFSGVSYAYVRPSTEPRIHDVRFKGQEHQLDRKVPTVLYHDEARDLWYCGAEAARLTEDDKRRLVKFEWFKLKLQPNYVEETSSSVRHSSSAERPTPVELFGIFFRYMHDCLKADFEATEFNGKNLWQKLASEAEYVITHPNDWSNGHHGALRSALVNAHIMEDEDSDRVTFLTEGEASLHWWLAEDPQSLEQGTEIVICDAGGGTIDVSSYTVSEVEPGPLKVREMKSCDTKYAGAAFVTRSFRDHITTKLRGSTFESADKIDRMVEKFELSVKRLFNVDAQAIQRIDFGFIDDNDAEYDIKSGSLNISRKVVERLFEPSCTAALEAIRNHANPNCYVVLVGGFSSSPWFSHRLTTSLTDVTQNVKCLSSQPGKAVARGAVEFCLNTRVTARVAKRTFGLPLDVPYSDNIPSHLQRQRKITLDPVSRTQLLPGRFYRLVRKGDIISDDSTHRIERTEYVEYDKKVHKVVFKLVEYIGRHQIIEFTDMDEASCFRPLGDFKARIPLAAFQLTEANSAGGKRYWEVMYRIVVTLGQAELKLSVEWVEKGETKRVPARARRGNY